VAFLFVDPSDNSLVIDGAYEERTKIADLGGCWDAIGKVWRVVFTIRNLELLLDAFPNVTISPDLELKTKEQIEKEAKLDKLRAMSKQDMPVCLKIPGLKLSLYNYQRLGVMYSTTNKTGLLLADEMGLGKGKIIGSYVFTKNGPVKIETVKVGDFIIGKNGKDTKVTGVYPQPVQDVYKVTFSDGFSTIVDGHHLWEVYSNNNNSTDRTTGGVVLSTHQLMDKNGIDYRNGVGRNKDKRYSFRTYYKKDNGDNKWSIPIVDPVEFEFQKVLIDPYILGVFLGDGHIGKSGRVSVGMLRTDLKEMSIGGKEIKCKKPHMSVEVFLKNHDEIKRLGLNGKLSWEKFVPNEYKYNSVEVRLAILRGLMDTDGHAEHCATEYSTTSKRLCDDVVEIVQTLGGIARVGIKKKPTYRYKGEKKYGRMAYRVNIKLPKGMMLFGLDRKIKDYVMCDKYLPARYICNIEKQEKQEKTICLSVDAPDSLYVTEHCIVTHNTLQAIGTALFLKAYNGAKKVLVVTPASLKFNWPLEIEKFTDEKYVVIDGTPEERVAQWLRDDVFFYIVNFELISEDLFGGRKFKIDPKESEEKREKKEKIMKRAHQRQRILSGVKARNWDFLVVDECFPYKTKIETDNGCMEIGDIVRNKLDVSVLSCDFSRNETSYKRVVRWIEKPLSGNLVEVTHENGRFVCTWNHKIWTEEYGWIEAGMLQNKVGKIHLRIMPFGVQFLQKGENDSEILFKKMLREVKMDGTGDKIRKKKNCKNMRILQKRIFNTSEGEINSKILLGDVFNDEFKSTAGNYGKNKSILCRQDNARGDFSLFGMRGNIHCSDCKGKDKTFLFKKLCSDMEGKKRIRMDRKSRKNEGCQCCSLQGWEKSTGIENDEEKQSKSGVSKESRGRCGKMEKNTSIISCTRRETVYYSSSENVIRGTREWVGPRTQGFGQEDGRSIELSSRILSNRCCQRGETYCCGSRWELTQNCEMEDNRCEEGKGFISSRLESVQVLERRDLERLGFCSAEDIKVYNLEVEADSDDDHCYVADGVLVSNCHAMKHHSASRTRNVKELKARCKMGLTGTPMDGRLEELHSIMQFIAPGLLMSKVRFFQRYVETDFYGRVTGYKNIGEVSQRIQPFFLRRLKKDVLKDLPDKVYENRIVVLSSEEMKIYKLLAENGHEATEDEMAMVAVIRCKQFCDIPNMVDEDCKKTSKLDAFKEVLEEVVQQNGHKALIFSQYKEVLNFLVPVLDQLGIKYMRIDGDVPPIQRAGMQKKFNEDKSIDVMIGTEAMSTGLNFQAADYVINYDDNWSPAIMAQREDRSHRNGQRNVVTVVSFICRDTVEERIRGVIYAKNRITSQTLGDETEDVILKRLGPKDIARLL
jgi:hypothetical protein